MTNWSAKAEDLPLFVPAAGGQGRHEIVDGLRLLEGQRAAVVAVNALGQLPLQVLDAAAHEMPLQLLIVLHPGGREVPDLLAQMHRRATARPNCSVRVLASLWGERHQDFVMLTRGPVEHGGRLQLALGSAVLTSETTPSCQVALEANDSLAYDAQVWFNNLWRGAAPLTLGLGAAYPDWLPRSAEPFAAEWELYRTSLRDWSYSEGRDVVDVGVGDSTIAGPISGLASPQEEARTAGGANLPASQIGGFESTSVVGVRQPAAVDEEIRALYARGQLVTVRLAEKIPTLRLDVTDVLGLPPRSEVGAATATSTIRLDLLPRSGRKAVDKLRREAGQILTRHSFLISEKQHWMVRAAEPYFMARLDALKPIEDISVFLGCSIPEYVAQRRDTLLQELWQVLQARRIDVQFDAKTVDRLVAAIHSHLEEHAKISIKPQYSREGLSFLGGDPSYSRPFDLLCKVGKTTRERLFSEGASAVRETEGPPLAVLDVVGGDGLVHRDRSDVAPIARRQLRKIREIEAGGPSEDGCLRLLQLLRSDSD